MPKHSFCEERLPKDIIAVAEVTCCYFFPLGEEKAEGWPPHDLQLLQGGQQR